MQTTKLKKWVKVTIITLVSLFAVMIGGVSLLLNSVVSPEKITPIINKNLATMVDGKSAIKSVNISFIRSFPDFRLEVDSVYIADSLSTELFSLEKLLVDINPIKYLISKSVEVNDIRLVKPKVYIYTSPEGVANYSIIKVATADSVASDTTQFKLSDYAKKISIKSISLDSATFIAVDDSLKNGLTIDGLSINLCGKFSNTISELQLNVELKSASSYRNGVRGFDDFMVDMSSNITFDRDSLLLTIKDSDIALRNINLNSSGTIRANRDSMNLDTNLKFYLAVNSLENIINKLPRRYIQKGQEFKATGKVELDGTVKGVFDRVRNKIPTVESKFAITGGSFKFDSMPYGVQKLDMLSTILIDGDSIPNSQFDLTKFTIASDAGINIDSKMVAKNILGDADVTFDVTSNANIAKIREVLPITEAVTLKGDNITKLKGSFKKSDLESRNFGAMIVDGNSQFKDLLLVVDGAKLPDSTAHDTYLYVEMKEGKFNFGSQTETVKELAGRQNLNADISFSGVGFRNKEGLEVEFSDIDFSAKSQLTGDTTAVIPVSGTLTLSRVDMAVMDTLRCFVSKSNIGFGIKAEKNNKSKAVVSFAIKADSIEAESIVNKTVASLDAASFSVKVVPDSTNKAGRSMSGRVTFKGLDLFSELFPVKMTMRNSRISFAKNRIELSKTRLKMGNSVIIATGSMENVIGRMFNLNENNITANLAINSKKINLTELYLASISADSVMAKDTTAIKKDIQTDVKDVVTIFQLPDYLNLKLNVDVTRTTFGDMVIDNMLGHIGVDKGLLTLDSLSLYGAGSRMNITAKYAPLSDSLAQTNFDLRAEGIVLEELVRIIPAIDSIMPMLSSVEGSLDFDMVARGQFNRYMDLDLQSLQSVMRFDGREMVLMDGATFTELSKTLMFKNKERNLIDSLKLDVIVRPGGKIDVPPFKMVMDRYSAVIAGTQNIDYNTFNVDYKYNISVLKSPLPFKAGIDIVGTNDDFKYDVTKAKLKRTDFDEVSRNVDSLVNVVKVGKHDL